MSRNRLYTILIMACVAGYIWLYANLSTNFTKNHSIEVCLIKHTTNIPCPSCGTTRSVISMIEGDFVRAFYWNPFGFLIALILLIAPVWISYDRIMRSDSFYKFYLKTESYITKPKIAAPLILFVLLNWAWNIAKNI